jgi:hypothetical protein
MTIAGIIDKIDMPPLVFPDEDFSENYRVSLLHKTDAEIMCWISSNLNVIRHGTKHTVGFPLRIKNGRANVSIAYDAKFALRSLGDTAYFTYESDGSMTEKTYVLPYEFENTTLPTAVADSSLHASLEEFFNLKTENVLRIYETVGELGMGRAFLYTRTSKEFKSRKKEMREVASNLEKKCQGFFCDELFESTPLRKKDLLFEDRKNTLLYERAGPKILLGIPILAAMPQSVLTDTLEQFQLSYDTRFSADSDDEMAALSSLLLGSPEQEKSAKNFLLGVKHFGNISAYAGLLGATVLANTTPLPLDSVLTLASVASGATMGYNAVRSLGDNSSGIISTVIDKYVYPKM